MTTTLAVRSLSPETRDTITRNAHARGMTNAQYLEMLVILHQDCIGLAKGSRDFLELLESLGLQAVTR